MNIVNEIITLNQLHEHMNLSYKTINETIVNTNLERSLLNGTNINSKSIDNCNFQLSEWTGAKVEDCHLINSNFKYAELKSTWFKNVRFENIVFDDSIISDSTFSDCTFYNCNISGTFFQENTFNNCRFEIIDFSDSSAYLNIFDTCTFIDSDICGSFYYSIFNNCSLTACRIDQYLMGYILGLLNSGLDNISYLKNKEIWNESFDELITDLIQEYETRMKFVNLAILKLNLYFESDVDKLIFACIKAFVLCQKKNITISSDDVKFIKYIIEEYYNKNLISPCMIFEASLLLHNEINLIESDFEQNKKQLKNLNNTLFFCQQDFIAKRTSKINIDKEKDYTLFIKYETEPQISIVKILKTLHPQYVIEPKILQTRTGSFLQWVQCDGNAIILFELLLGFLNVSVPIVYDIIKEKRKEKKQNELEHKSQSTINIDTLQISLNNFNSVQNLGNILNTVGTCNFSISNEFMGYNNSNIKEIKIMR